MGKPTKILEGFWRTPNEPDLPNPVARPKPFRYQFLAIAIMEKAQSKATTAHFKGSSKCRVCGKTNGSAEYRYKNAVWPEGLLHYVKDHNVAVSTKFLQEIGGK